GLIPVQANGPSHDPSGGTQGCRGGRTPSIGGLLCRSLRRRGRSSIPAGRRRAYLCRKRRRVMLWTITVILLVLWVLGLVSGAQIGAWIHILLILAVISLIFAVLRRGTGAAVP